MGVVVRDRRMAALICGVEEGPFICYIYVSELSSLSLKTIEK